MTESARDGPARRIRRVTRSTWMTWGVRAETTRYNAGSLVRICPSRSRQSVRREFRPCDAVRRRPKKRIAVAGPTRVLVRRSRFRRAVATGCGAAIALVVGSSIVPRHAHTIGGRALGRARPRLPLAVGNHIPVRSGAMGGEFYGAVSSMSLTYVSILTDEGMLKVPNSSFAGRRGELVGPLLAPPPRVGTDRTTGRPMRRRAPVCTTDRTRSRTSPPACGGWSAPPPRRRPG
jgi:hypothetical protein